MLVIVCVAWSWGTGTGVLVSDGVVERLGDGIAMRWEELTMMAIGGREERARGELFKEGRLKFWMLPVCVVFFNAVVCQDGVGSF